MPTRSPAVAGAIPFDQTIRKITAWPNHANRNLPLHERTDRSRRSDGTACARCCLHLGSPTTLNIFLANSSFCRAPRVRLERKLPRSIAFDDHLIRNFRLCFFTQPDHSAAIRKALRADFSVVGHATSLTDPISTCRGHHTHLQEEVSSRPNGRLRAIGGTVATHEIATAIIRQRNDLVAPRLRPQIG
jgi:hypothetical protein